MSQKFGYIERTRKQSAMRIGKAETDLSDVKTALYTAVIDDIDERLAEAMISTESCSSDLNDIIMVGMTISTVRHEILNSERDVGTEKINTMLKRLDKVHSDLDRASYSFIHKCVHTKIT